MDWEYENNKFSCETEYNNKNNNWLLNQLMYRNQTIPNKWYKGTNQTIVFGYIMINKMNL